MAPGRPDVRPLRAPAAGLRASAGAWARVPLPASSRAPPAPRAGETRTAAARTPARGWESPARFQVPAPAQTRELREFQIRLPPEARLAGLPYARLSVALDTRRVRARGPFFRRASSPNAHKF